MNKKEWKRRAKDAEFRAAGVTVAIKAETLQGFLCMNVVQRGTSMQIPIQTADPNLGPVMFTVTVA